MERRDCVVTIAPGYERQRFEHSREVIGLETVEPGHQSLEFRPRLSIVVVGTSRHEARQRGEAPEHRRVRRWLRDGQPLDDRDGHVCTDLRPDQVVRHVAVECREEKPLGFDRQ